jgi:hypothetical protein
MVWALTFLSIGVSVYAAVHLAHLPYAPQCPDCRTLTGRPSRTTLLDRFLGSVANAAARECPRCGWSGRMRWRLAVHRTRLD